MRDSGLRPHFPHGAYHWKKYDMSLCFMEFMVRIYIAFGWRDRCQSTGKVPTDKTRHKPNQIKCVTIKLPDFMNLFYSSLSLFLFCMFAPCFWFGCCLYGWIPADAASMEGVPRVLSTGIVARGTNHRFEANRIGPVRRTVARRKTWCGQHSS